MIEKVRFWVVLRFSISLDNADAKSKKNGGWSWTKYAYVGAGAVVGGAALVLTGGLAAPAVAAGFTALGNVALIGGVSVSLSLFNPPL